MIQALTSLFWPRPDYSVLDEPLVEEKLGNRDEVEAQALHIITILGEQLDPRYLLPAKVLQVISHYRKELNQLNERDSRVGEIVTDILLAPHQASALALPSTDSPEFQLLLELKVYFQCSKPLTLLFDYEHLVHCWLLGDLSYKKLLRSVISHAPSRGFHSVLERFIKEPGVQALRQSENLRGQFLITALQLGNVKAIRPLAEALYSKEELIQLLDVVMGEALASKHSAVIEEVLSLYHELDHTAYLRALQEEFNGHKVLEKAATCDHALLQRVIKRYQDAGPLVLKAALSPGARGFTALHTAASTSKSNTLAIIKLAASLGSDVLMDALRPDKDGKTVLQIAADYGCIETFLFVASLVEGLPTRQLEAQFQASTNGDTALHEALQAHGEQATKRLRILRPLLIKLRPAALRKLTQANRAGQTVLSLASKQPSTLEELFQIFKGDQRAYLADALALSVRGVSPLDQGAKSHLVQLTELLAHITDEWSMARALGRKGFEVCRGQLAKQFPDPKARRRIFYKNYLCHWCGQIPRHKSYNVETDAMTEICREQLRFAGPDLDLTVAALLASEGGEKDLREMKPLFSRLADLNALNKHKFLAPLGRYGLARVGTCTTLSPNLIQSAGDKRPLLYLIPLAVMEQQGVDPTLTTAFAEWIQSFDTHFHEKTSAGRELLELLQWMNEEETFRPFEKARLLTSIIKSQSTRGILALKEIRKMKKVETLKGQASVKDLDLRAIADRGFCELLYMEAVSDFRQKWAERIASQRHPESLFTYALKLKDWVGTRRELGTWVRAVLEGQDRELRYAADSTPHLRELYRLVPKLATQLPDLCQSIKPQTVASLSTKGGGSGFPLDRDKIYEKVITDKHLQAERFPLLFAVLSGKRADWKKLIQEASKEIQRINNSKAKSSTGTNKKEQVAILKLQQRLIKLYSISSAPLRRKLLHQAYQISQQISNIPDFRNDLKAACTQLFNQTKSDLDNFQVSLTDHYWDLLRIGSDIQGSCQSVDGQGKLNRCLLDYVMHGKNFALVVKNGEQIVARRMLRIEIDEESQSPALFLERLYSNYQQDRVDEALVTVAKQLSDRLGFPLYSKDLPGEKTTTTLVSKGSSVSYAYSDAGGGVTGGSYRVSNPVLLHQPKESDQACSSSTK